MTLALPPTTRVPLTHTNPTKIPRLTLDLDLEINTKEPFLSLHAIISQTTTPLLPPTTRFPCAFPQSCSSGATSPWRRITCCWCPRTRWLEDGDFQINSRRNWKFLLIALQLHRISQRYRDIFVFFSGIPSGWGPEEVRRRPWLLRLRHAHSRGEQ